MTNLEAAQMYQQALKQGQKEHKACVHRGRWPHIQPLGDDKLSLPQVRLGMMEIPSYLVVGAVETARCSSFSPSFQPLLGANTEFAMKWTSLCQAQVEEGIHTPIQCFEYLGYFYVREGNKRVSVLRSLGATTVPAEVIRLMPEQSDDVTIRIYFEFLEFYRHARCWGLHFSDLGSYARLQTALGFIGEQDWPEEFRRAFRNRFYEFRSAYYSLGGGSLGLTTGDALLHWLRFYSVAEFFGMREPQYRETLTKIWKELCLRTDEQPITLEASPAPEEKKGVSALLDGAKTLLSDKKSLRIAFLYHGTPESSGWTAAHDRGRVYLEEHMPEGVSVICFYDVTQHNMESMVELAIAEGAEVVFVTAVSLIDETLRTAIKHPEIRFYNCSIDQPSVNVTGYYCRMYEAKFITGAIAGALSKTGEIGYVGSYPILGVPAGINAFALGASLTNPQAHIRLGWHCMEDDYMADFRRRGIRLVSDRDYMPEQPFGGRGLAWLGEDGELRQLASPQWRWGAFYLRVVQELLRAPRSAAAENGKAVNLWWGMDSDAVGLHLSPDLPEGVTALADILSRGIRSGEIRPFQRVLRTQQGIRISDGSRNLSMEEILKMDWLCDRVSGKIPSYDEILPVARFTVRRLGVMRDQIPADKEAEECD